MAKSKVVDKTFNISENPSSSDQLESDSTQPSGNYNSNYTPTMSLFLCVCFLLIMVLK